MIGIRTPWRAFSSARSASGRAFHSSSHAQCTTWPVVSVRPYTCSTSNPSRSTRSSTAAGGGAPAVITWTLPGSGRRSSAGASASMPSTVGAPPMCVMPYPAMASNIARAVTWRIRKAVPPVIVSAHACVQPLQWNSGTV